MIKRQPREMACFGQMPKGHLNIIARHGHAVQTSLLARCAVQCPLLARYAVQCSLFSTECHSMPSF
jgi:hypothetical protein